MKKEKQVETEKKVIKRPGAGKGSGGARPGSGRKLGSGIVSKNKVIRVPVELLNEARDKKVKNLTKMFIDGARLILSNIQK